MPMSLFSKIQKYKTQIVVCVIVLWAMYLRIMQVVYNPTFWVDEQRAVNFMERSGSFLNMLKHLPDAEVGGYLAGDYVILYPFLKIFGPTRWALAVPHLAVTLVGFFLLYLIGRRYFQSIWGYAIAFSIMCFNRNLIFHASEVRPYAILPTIALLVFYCTALLFDDYERLSARQKLWLGLDRKS